MLQTLLTTRRKQLAVVVALSLAIASFGFTATAQAQNVSTVSLQAPASASPGDTITLNLSLDLAGVDYTAGLYTVFYDASVVDATECTPVQGSGACNLDVPGEITFGHFEFANADILGGDIGEFTLDVLASAPTGTTSFDLETVDFFGENEQELDSISVDASTDIVDEPQPEPVSHNPYRRFLRWLIRFLLRWSHGSPGWH